MGTWTFSRATDMFEFFAWGDETYTNPEYWSEKLDDPQRARQHSETVTTKTLRDWVAETAAYLRWGCDDDTGHDDAKAFIEAAKEELLENGYGELGHADSTYRQVSEFAWRGHSYELDGNEFTDWVYQFTWCCHAIRWGVEQYRATTFPTDMGIYPAGRARPVQNLALPVGGAA
jgi:hypothetical protein